MHEQSKIVEAVQAQIRAGRLRMHSSAYFIARAVLLVILLMGVFVFSTIIVNFILLTIHLQGHHALLNFGPRGWLAFLTFFPWPLFLIDLLLIGGSIALIRTFRFGYSRSVLALLGGTAFAVIVLGFCIEEYTGINGALIEEGDRVALPEPLQTFVVSLSTPPPFRQGVCRCEVVDILPDNRIIARDVRNGAPLTIVVPEGFGTSTTHTLTVGDIIYIAGDYDEDNDADDSIRIFGITKMGAMSSPMHRRPMVK